ncbi:type II toxin-antitoxin system RelE/ParE family toxin [Candidatus Dojkabacteria bacterium]|nr:type II toxin-antitoxin system RelE/ParE family toxin [Candidatus Dojkabacteria bacterium]
MIKSFKSKETAEIFNNQFCGKFGELTRKAQLKLKIINAACNLHDLSIPPGNRLEKLKGNKADIYSIRLNDQWRICFKWVNDNAWEVGIVDYH